MNCKDFLKNILMIIYCVILLSGDNIAVLKWHLSNDETPKKTNGQTFCVCVP